MSCILGHVWYLIVSIPDLCTFTYFVNKKNSHISFSWRNCLIVKLDQGEKDIHMHLERFQGEMLDENELWPLLMNPYHLNESIFMGIRKILFIFISFFYAFPVSIYNGPRWDDTFLQHHIFGH